jgi:hypothetical protein
LSDDVIDERSAPKFPKQAILFPLFLRLVKQRIPKSASKGYEGRYAGLIGDEADVPVLAATAVSRADYFVSGDKGILALKRIGDTEIIRTSKLLKKLRNLKTVHGDLKVPGLLRVAIQQTGLSSWSGHGAPL